MKKLTLLLLVLLSGQIILAQYNVIDTSFYSQTLGEEKMVAVYLPPGYNENPNMHYPVIYYLHGWTQDHNTMGSEMMPVTETMILDSTINPVIMVSTDNNPDPFDGSMYMNSPIWGNYEEFMINDLLNWVEVTFRAEPSRDYRALLGISMGGYGVFRYGILHKDKFRVISAAAVQALSITEPALEALRVKILEQNQPGPPYYYDYYNTGGTTTMFTFLMCGAFTPNLNSPQPYINPQIVNWPLDENGDYIDSTINTFTDHLIVEYIDQLHPEDSLGILFGCGSADVSIYPFHIAFKDTLNAHNLPYEFYDHNGGHIMPLGYKQRSLVFIDSLLMDPFFVSGLNNPVQKSNYHLSVFPNPTDNATTLFFNSKKLESLSLTIRDIKGKEVKQIHFGKTKRVNYEINCTEYSSGIYFVTLKTDSRILTKKLVIE